MRTSVIYHFTFIAFLLLGFNSKVLAKSEKPIITYIENSTISISFHQWVSSEVEIKLIDLQGEVLMSDDINTKDIRVRNYNLRNLPYGTYILEIDDNQKVITTTLSIVGKNIKIMHETILYKPTIMYQNKRWKFSLLALGRNVSTKIIDKEGNIVFDEEFKDFGSIHRSYDLSKLIKGEYKLLVYIGDKVFHHGYIMI